MTIPLTASVIVPVAVTDAILISCTVAEPAVGEVEWISGTTYAVGDIRIRAQTHKRYKRMIAGAGTTAPELDTANWLDIGATARWAQFDKKIGTATSAAGGVTTVLAPGIVQGLALLELMGTSAHVQMMDAPGGTVIYDRTINLDGSIIGSVYDWMYGERLQKRNLILTDLPGQFPSCRVTVTISATGTASMGVLVTGRVQSIGSTEYGAGSGILNFGKITDDGFGNREWIEGEWANRVTLPLIANRTDLNRIHRQLAALRSTPCIYIGTEIDGFDPLICYGVYKDLYVTIPNFPFISLNLEIDGLNNF